MKEFKKVLWSRDGGKTSSPFRPIEETIIARAGIPFYRMHWC